MLNGMMTTRVETVKVDRKQITVKQHSVLNPAVGDKYEIWITINDERHIMYGAFCQVHPVEHAKSFWCPTALTFSEAKRAKEMFISRGVDVCR